ncbi:MAG TPA: ribonuclease III domain-containing protein [Clostridiales bacterium]|nr:ribonuclease III domain-containing protein [Clostridiales bacterium]
MNRFLETETDPNSLSMLDLAFLGDAVHELFVRQALLLEGARPTADLHAEKVNFVNADAQAEAAAVLAPFLTEKEAKIYRRGRNAKTNHTPRNKSSAAYHAATGFEALFGYLYLDGQLARLRELFQITYVHALRSASSEAGNFPASAKAAAPPASASFNQAVAPSAFSGVAQKEASSVTQKPNETAVQDCRASGNAPPS